MTENQSVKLIKEIIANERVAIEELERKSSKPQSALIALRANKQRLEYLSVYLMRLAPKKVEDRGMTYRTMIAKVQQDLNIPYYRARKHIEKFSKLYSGDKKAIMGVKASYTDDGLVKITYTINDKDNSIVLKEDETSTNKQQ